MPEPGPLGETLFEAKVRAMVAASLVKESFRGMGRIGLHRGNPSLRLIGFRSCARADQVCCGGCFLARWHGLAPLCDLLRAVSFEDLVRGPRMHASASESITAPPPQPGE